MMSRSGVALLLQTLFAVLMKFIAAQKDTYAIFHLCDVNSEIPNKNYISRASNYRFLQTQTNMNETEWVMTITINAVVCSFWT